MKVQFVVLVGLVGIGLAAWATVVRSPARPGQVQSKVQVVRVTAEPGLRFGGRVPGPLLRVRARQPVRLVLENRDILQHDLWVVQRNERAPYLEPAFPNAKTRLVEPGKREEIQFIPTRPGRYRYVCTVPGHEATMHGEFVVE